MIEVVKNPSWMTLRFFLSNEGVHEVFFDSNRVMSALRCTCSGFVENGGCPHVRWSAVNDDLEGSRSMVRSKVSPRDASGWRSKVLHSKRVEVI